MLKEKFASTEGLIEQANYEGDKTDHWENGAVGGFGAGSVNNSCCFSFCHVLLKDTLKYGLPHLQALSFLWEVEKRRFI